MNQGALHICMPVTGVAVDEYVLTSLNKYQGTEFLNDMLKLHLVL